MTFEIGSGDLHITADELRVRIVELGKIIARDYEGLHLHVVCVLTGGFVFTADLVRTIDLEMTIGFVSMRSYRGGFKRGQTESTAMNRGVPDVKGRHVLVVDDIVDTGITIQQVRDQILESGARSVRVAALLEKRDRRVAEVEVDYVGFRVDGKYVYGFGLDKGELYRNLPFVTSVEFLESD